MIVEDEVIVALDIQDRLTELGYDVVGLTDRGEEALALVETIQPDLVLMDIRLKGSMDGITTAQVIRQRWRIPVIYLTAFSEDNTLERAKVTEPSGYIIKPFEDREIQAAIEMALYKHQAEQRLRESEERFKRLFELEPDALIFADTETWEILEVNEATVNLYGYSREELLKLRPTDLSAQPEATAKAMQNGDRNIPLRIHRRKDGTEFPVEITTSTFEWRGRRVQFGAIRDITERVHAEEEREKAMALLEAAIVQSPSGIVVAEAPGVTIRMANPEALRILGWGAPPLAGTTAQQHLDRWQVFHSDGLPYLPQDLPLFRAVLKGETTLNEEMIFRREDREDRWHSVNAAPIRNRKGEIIAGIVVFHDITERKRAEADRMEMERRLLHVQKLESLGVLAGGIAHDFNNLLMAILGYADLALVELSPVSPARPSLQEIVNASHRAADLCRQMLAYSGRGKFVVENLQLNEVVQEMVHMLKTCISKKVLLNLNLAKDLPSIDGDPAQVRQLLMNLVINSSEAIGDKSGMVTVSTEARHFDTDYLQDTFVDDSLPDGFYVSLEVSDTGCGMDRNTQARIFEPFFTTKFTGRGLGMAAVLGIVRGHKGAIKVYSEPGIGTTFRILFPALAEAEKEASARHLESESKWRGTGTVLLVDDEETILAVGRLMLEKLGFSVITARDGLEAVEVYRSRSNEITFVLLDLTMPRMSGEEAFRELRGINPGVRVVISSGYSEQEIAARFAGKGLTGLIQKPYQLAKLRDALKGIVQSL